MSDAFTGDVETALSKTETMYSSKDSINVKTLKGIINILQDQVTQVKNISGINLEKYKTMVVFTESGKLKNDPSVFADLLAIEGVVNAVEILLESVPETINKLAAMDLNNLSPLDPELLQKRAQIARELQESGVFVRSALSIISIIESTISNENPNLALSNRNEQTIDKLKEVSKQLSDLIIGPNKLFDVIKLKERDLFLNFFRRYNG